MRRAFFIGVARFRRQPGWRSVAVTGPLGGLVAGLMASLHGGNAASTHYTLQHSTWDSGGGAAGSTHYALVSSLGAPAGTTRSQGGAVSDIGGFPGVLNEPPQPSADTVSRGAGLPLKVRVAGLLANDRDPESDSLRLRSFDALTDAGGRVTFDNGWLLYEPPASPGAADTFTYTIEDAAGNPATALVTVLVAGTGSQPSQNLIAITVLPDGHRHLAFAGIAGRPYAIEWSDALPATSWEVLAVLAADAHGLIEWVDASEPAPAQRYYRTVGR